MSKISELAKQGIFYTPLTEEAPKEEETGDFMRGLKKAGYQIPQTLGGAAALVGDMVGADGLKDYGLGVYQNNEAKIQAISKESDSLSNVLDGDASGVDWAQNAAGYVAGQAATAIATGGVGGFIGSQLAKRGIREVVARGAQSAAAKEVAGKVAAKGAKIGAASGLFGLNLTQEAGSIYPEALKHAEEEGRTLDASDKARVVGASLAAAGVDTAMDALMLGRVLKGGRKPGESLAGAAMREIPGAMARETVTEGIQTGIERWGAQKELTTAEAVREYVDSMGVGAMGGGMGGALAVISKQKVPVSGPLTQAANAGIDDQILQLGHDPQPMIGFPDGSVGHKQDVEAYLSQFTDPEERTAKRRELMGLDPATGKKIEPEPAPEPTAAASKEDEKAQLSAWGEQAESVELDYAHALVKAPGAKGQSLMVAPHPSGEGYTVVPSAMLTLDTQAKLAELQKPVKADTKEKPDAVPATAEDGGVRSVPVPDVGPGAADAAREQGADVAVSGLDAAPAAAALTEPEWKTNPYTAYKFADRAKAEQFLVNKKADPAEFEARETTPGRFEIKRKAEPDPVAIDAAAHEAATSPANDLPEPTQAQKEAGNYRKGHVQMHGLDIAIENPAGSIRKGVDKAGKPWENELAHHYGYIKKTTGADGDHVDTFIGPNVASDRAFVVDQIDPDTGAFDEHKIVLGADSLDEARAIYEANYAKGWKGGKDISETSVEGFKTWLKDGDTTKPYAPQATKDTNENDVPAAARATEPDDGAGAGSGSDPAATAADAGTTAQPAAIPDGDVSVRPDVQEAEEKAPVDAGDGIPKAFFKKVKVPHDVYAEDTGDVESIEVPADQALASVREDIANLKALIKCMKG